ncbi:hypothetical protein H2203_001755 [Taxawa tesnikishii (nom. ined.)]|nr:hypothetical protein H2203_001755 [Dothideales sp. JES 119]
MNEESDDGSVYRESSTERHLDQEDEASTASEAQDSELESGNVELQELSVRAQNLRKAKEKEIRLRSKRLRLSGHYSNPYRELLNETILEASGQVPPDPAQMEPSSTIGLSSWTSTEKEVFFQKLAILGKDNIRGIASAIETKTEMEVRDYMLLLQEGVVQDNFTGTHHDFASADIPAAAEISSECEIVLNLAAEALSWQVEKAEVNREEKKHGSYWLLNEEIAAEIGAKMKVEKGKVQDVSDGEVRQQEHKVENEDVGDEGPTTQDEGVLQDAELPVPAANLLRLPIWLRLSQLFMGKGPGLKEGWMSLIEDIDQGPSIYRTAFEDFHNLAISLTRRLIQASIFQFHSRMRAREHLGDLKPAVRPADVRTAVDILGLKSNTKEFWATAARRNKWDVYTDMRSYRGNKSERHRLGVRLTYDEVEAELGIATSQPDPSEDVIPTVEEDVDLVEYYDDPDLWTEASYSGDDSDDENAEEREANQSTDPRPIDVASEFDYHPDTTDYETDREQQEELYTEAFDAQVSGIEERRLWSIVGREPPTHLKVEETELPRMPIRKRRKHVELQDWRDRVEYRAPWEKFDEPVAAGEFRRVGERGALARKRRRVAYQLIREQGFEVVYHDEDVVDREEGAASSSSDIDEDESIHSAASASADMSEDEATADTDGSQQ